MEAKWNMSSSNKHSVLNPWFKYWTAEDSFWRFDSKWSWFTASQRYFYIPHGQEYLCLKGVDRLLNVGLVCRHNHIWDRMSKEGKIDPIK